MMKSNSKLGESVNFSVYLTVSNKNSKPCIEIRKNTTNPEDIKTIINAAINEQPIIVFPVFRDRIQAINTLINRGIIEYDSEKNKYSYII